MHLDKIIFSFLKKKGTFIFSLFFIVFLMVAQKHIFHSGKKKSFESFPISFQDSLEKIEYASLKDSLIIWKMTLESAFLSENHDILEGKKMSLTVWDSQRLKTVITGAQARYERKKKILEITEQVETIFPDGFHLYSEYLRYSPETSLITIPPPYQSSGKSSSAEKYTFFFQTTGLSYHLMNQLMELEQKVHVRFRQKLDLSSGSSFQETFLDSDRCQIDHHKKIAYFLMTPSSLTEGKKVFLKQPDLTLSAETLTLHYGDTAPLVNYLVASDHVFIEEKKKSSLSPQRRATAGKAEFHKTSDEIILKEYPQIYENSDTMTGSVIHWNRKTEVIEVFSGNAYSHGKKKNI